MNRIGVGVGVVVAVVALFIGVLVWRAGHGETSRLLWYVESVSADARTIGVVHEAASCTTKAGPTTVVERPTSVSIAVTERHVSRVGDGACPDVLRSAVTRVRLNAPLGTRRLRQPPGGSGDRDFLRRIAGLRNGDCPAFRRLPVDARARDVPWVTRRAKICSDPVRRGVRALPVLRRLASRADRLPRSIQAYATISARVLRTDLARGALGPVRVWLVPGPRQSCMFARFGVDEGDESSCVSSRRLARHGTFISRYCASGRRGNRRRSLAGVVLAAETVRRTVCEAVAT